MNIRTGKKEPYIFCDDPVKDAEVYNGNIYYITSKDGYFFDNYKSRGVKVKAADMNSGKISVLAKLKTTDEESWWRIIAARKEGVYLRTSKAVYLLSYNGELNRVMPVSGQDIYFCNELFYEAFYKSVNYDYVVNAYGKFIFDKICAYSAEGDMIYEFDNTEGYTFDGIYEGINPRLTWYNGKLVASLDKNIYLFDPESGERELLIEDYYPERDKYGNLNPAFSACAAGNKLLIYTYANEKLYIFGD